MRFGGVFCYIPSVSDVKGIFVTTITIPEKTSDRWGAVASRHAAMQYLNPLSMEECRSVIDAQDKVFDEMLAIAGAELKAAGFDSRKRHMLTYRQDAFDPTQIHVGYDTGEMEIEGVPDEA